MGYCTHYELDADPWPETLSALIESEEIEELSYAIEPNGNSSESAKWYEHETDMITLSLKFPGVLFTLSGEGEEAGDIWVKNFKDGKIQRRKGEVVIPPFDPNKWEKR